MTQSEESMTLMTFYGFPHHGNRSFAVASGWRFTDALITGTDSSLALRMESGRPWSFWTKGKKLCEKDGKRAVPQSEESITRMTFYGFPHHGNRSFVVASGWRFTGSLITGTDSSLALRMGPCHQCCFHRQIKTEGYDGLFGIRGAVSLECKELIFLCFFREMKWQMVGFVREGNMAAAIFLQPGKNPW